MKKFIFMAICLATVSCAFKSGDQSGGSGSEIATTSGLKIDPNSDSDGDGTKDGDEVVRGSNPFVADLPDLKVRFLQNYKIEIFYHIKGNESDQKSVVINTNVKDTNPDFKFRVGNVFARLHANKTAASIGRFSSHNSGAIEDHDLSWVSYPELDPKFFNNISLQYRDLFNDPNVIDDIKITLTNQVKLNESPIFREIKDLSLNFYFLNHETENYELLSNVKVDRHFQTGIFETFDVVIDHAPIGLIKESFFKHGEFIISEVDDYFIPSLETNFKALISGIKAKTIPVLYETPLDEKVYYVASGSNGVRFQGILKVVFDKNFEVKEESLNKIGQFSNNLTDFNHLKEIKDKDKLGKWFVMTSEFKENYLDHLYKPSDRIVLSFITGSDLSNQENEKIYSYVKNVDGNKSESIIPLGNISPNSSIEFTVKPIDRFGRTVTHTREVIDHPTQSCGKNCISVAQKCVWEINQFVDYNEPFSIASDLSNEGQKLDLVINEESFKLSDLLKDKKIILSKLNEFLQIEIPDISKIKDIKEFEENQLSLKVKSSIFNDFFGVKLTDVGGAWQGFGGCMFTTPMVAEKFKTQVSSETRNLDETLYWANLANQRGWPYKIIKMDSGNYYQEISIGVSSSITNFYN